ncbi:Endolytic murein transglycosylase [Thalassocella blandensis]|nr:Endolytic murein transglycosylase [Thalassocella blandensis]
MNTKVVKIFAVLFFWMVATMAATSMYFWHWLYTPHQVEHEEFVFTVNKGASLYSVANDLQQLSVLRWPTIWVWYARATKQTGLKTGEYVLQGDESPVAVLRKLLSSDVVKYHVTLVEGSTFKDFVNTLHQQEKLSKQLVPGEELIQLHARGLDIEHPEGWFFPDTYQYVAGDSDLSILFRAYKKMQAMLEQEWEARAEGLPYSNPYEALIMASIVEKETGVAHEREEIAGVFVRRLQLNMRLQTDPTVIYGMGDLYNGNITRKDLRTDTPYNTYVIRGLPPTPIAMPGRGAIYAALHPEEGDALYFVAKGDGTHQFSATLDEHINAVNQYQKKRRKDYRSSPERKSLDEKSDEQ